MLDQPIPIIDLFAGPGGLGEGFSSFQAGIHKFETALSIEKDISAHQTLKLRHFFRSFDRVPDEYYQFLASQISLEKLYEKYPEEAKLADERSWLCTLGDEPHKNVYNKIKQALGNQKNWVLVGGPPCQAYSLVGRSRRANDKTFEQDHKHFLYKEYLKIIADHEPPVFVMENVKGLLSAKHSGKSMVHVILNDLADPHTALQMKGAGTKYKLYSLSTGKFYKEGMPPSDFIVKAEEYGVPQARHRLLILGIREDIAFEPETFAPSKAPTVADVIGDMPKIRSSISRSSEDWLEVIRKFADKLGLESKFTNLPVTSSKPTKPKSLQDWLYDSRITSMTGHTARAHMKSDLARYLFVSSAAQENGYSPKLADFPKRLLPKHKNVSEAVAGKMFSDRFRVQLADKPSTTVTSHISKDGHYFIHYDPAQCRSLTVREAARLQTFPDNYHFLGNRTAQFHQVGNAVPPFLARQIAHVVQKLFERLESDGSAYTRAA
jgi:DNA (cytosine-5)-methyltransferase 1